MLIKFKIVYQRYLKVSKAHLAWLGLVWERTLNLIKKEIMFKDICCVVRSKLLKYDFQYLFTKILLQQNKSQGTLTEGEGSVQLTSLY
jgi:hypothetical protein